MDYECSICFEPFILKCITSCNHKFCKLCLHRWFQKNKISCPICRKNILYYNLHGEQYEVIIYKKIII
jgi:E3 ubiquitin-protein ligase SHPRH